MSGYVKKPYEIAEWDKQGQKTNFRTGTFTINEYEIQHEGKTILLRDLKFPFVIFPNSKKTGNQPDWRGEPSKAYTGAPASAPDFGVQQAKSIKENLMKPKVEKKEDDFFDDLPF